MVTENWKKLDVDNDIKLFEHYYFDESTGINFFSFYATIKLSEDKGLKCLVEIFLSDLLYVER